MDKYKVELSIVHIDLKSQVSRLIIYLSGSLYLLLEEVLSVAQ